jgi:hypothetical protein
MNTMTNETGIRALSGDELDLVTGGAIAQGVTAAVNHLGDGGNANRSVAAPAAAAFVVSPLLALWGLGWI